MKLSERLDKWFDTEEGCDEVMDCIIGDLQLLEQQKDIAYSERNKLVALISKCFPSSLERHSETDELWEDDWRWIVFVNLPTGQVSWHIHDSELPLFEHLNMHQGINKWDGHTTKQKYERLHNVKHVSAWVAAREHIET